MKYPVAEKFKAPQGEGVYTGTPMAFIRFVGCSVGKGVCTSCDTDFDKPYPELGGGIFTSEQLLGWLEPFEHVCLTGGEPLDRDLTPLIEILLSERSPVKMVHVETSGTRPIPTQWFSWASTDSVWLTVSPKPGYKETVVVLADEVKVILEGLGDGPGWPTLTDALRWARRGVPVYLQPRNEVKTIHHLNMVNAIDTVMENPSLRLSAQLHKYVRTR